MEAESKDCQNENASKMHRGVKKKNSHTWLPHLVSLSFFFLNENWQAYANGYEQR